MSSNCRDSQRGAALIVALVVVLLVVMLATRVSSDYLVLFRTVENQAELQQARAYLRGAELVAERALLRDLELSGELDSALEPWAQRATLPLPEGLLSACLRDVQARLNLNDLQGAEGSYTSAQKRFIRLLQAVDDDIDRSAALALAHAVFDWLDPDDDQRYPGGAEALDYLRLPQPYRPANQAFASVSELLLVQGFTPALVAALTPHLSVWGNGNLNLNSLDAQLDARAELDAAAPVMLRTLNAADSLLPLSVDAARLLAAARGSSGGAVQNLALFNEAPFNTLAWELDGIAVTSAYFELNAVMQTPRRSYALTAVLRRVVNGSGVPEIAVVSRRFGSAADAAVEGACAATLP